jgi:chloramphenicol O-acetyltransferase type A
VPKIAFGRIEPEGDGGKQWMPLSLEVHHALVDGLHVGRYVQALEAALATPANWLR